MGLLDTLKDALKGKGVPAGLGSGPAKTVTQDEALSQYATDLNLQNLLVLGAEFKPDDIIDLRRRARYGDPRWLYALYDEMNRLGPAPQISKMRMALKSTESVWTAQPDDYDDDSESDPEAKAARLIRDVCEEAWGKWLPALKEHHSSKHLYGIAAMQIIVEPRGVADRWERVIDVRPIPARRFRLDPMTRRFLFLPKPTSWEGFPVDDLINKGQLFWSETGKDVEPLDQRGLLFQCLIPWAIHQYIVRWRAKRMELYGLPPRIVTYKPGSPNAKEIAEHVAQMIGTASWAAIPEPMKAELLTLPTGRGVDPYTEAIEWAVRTYDQLILGHSQASGVQVGAGSRTSSEAATEMAKDLINSRSAEFDDDFCRSPLFLYVKRNFGEDWAQTSTPKLESHIIEHDDATMLSNVAATLAKSGAAKLVDGLDVVRRCGFKVAEDGDTALDGSVVGEEPETPPPGPPGAQPPQLGPDGKPLPPQSGQPPQLAPGQPGSAPPPAPGQQKALPEAGNGETAKGKGDDEKKPVAVKGKGEKMGVPLGASGQPAAWVLRKRRKNVAEMRQRFAVAVSTFRPRIIIETFAYGAAPDADVLLDARPLARVDEDALDAHPRTRIIMRAVSAAAKRAISAAQLTGASECRLAVGDDALDGRAAYAAEQLRIELTKDKHDVTVVERAEAPVLTTQERFWSPDQPRDEDGRWSGDAGAAERAGTPQEHAAAAAYHRERAAGLAAKAEEHAKAGDAYARMVTEASAANHTTAAQAHERATELNHPHASKAARDHSRDAHFAHTRTLGPGSMYRKYSRGASTKLSAERFYSEDQERDERGRWTSTGASGDTGGSRTPGIEWKQDVDKATGRPIPIKVASVEAAIPLVLEGKVVELPDVRTVSTLIDKLRDMALEAKAAGKDAPQYDLCNVTVPGTNLFCADKVRTREFPEGIPRIAMPQLAGEPMPGSAAALLKPEIEGSTEVNGASHFISYMAGLGYGVKDEQVLASSLKASQAELVGQKVAGIMKAAETNRSIIDSPIFVSRDNYVIDGHHRWAAVVGLDTGKGKFSTKMHIHRIDAPITEVLQLANKWSERFGIKQAAGVSHKKHSVETHTIKFEVDASHALAEIEKLGRAASRIPGLRFTSIEDVTPKKPASFQRTHEELASTVRERLAKQHEKAAAVADEKIPEAPAGDAP